MSGSAALATILLVCVGCIASIVALGRALDRRHARREDALRRDFLMVVHTDQIGGRYFLTWDNQWSANRIDGQLFDVRSTAASDAAAEHGGHVVTVRR